MRIVSSIASTWACAALLSFSGTSTGNGQGTFRNMDFALSQVPPSTPNGTLVPASQAVPFWTAYVGTSQLTEVLYNNSNIGSPGVSFLTPNSPVGALIPGFNTVLLQAGVTPAGATSAAIAQAGMIPVWAVSLLFVANTPPAAGWQVTLGNQTIPVVEVHPVTPFLNEYAADLSAFVGQTGELRFTALAGVSGGNMFLGDIQFFSTPVPEPSPLGLAVFGTLVVGLFRNKHVLRD